MKNRKRNGKMSRSAFIRSQPVSLPADDVVAAGKKIGLEIKRDMVHKVRWQRKAHEKIHGKGSGVVKPKTVRGIKNGKPKELPDDEMSTVAFASLQLVIRTEVRREMRRIMGAVEA